MRLILSLSLRNLIRQKRRNSLLGIGIAFGMTILVVANSFSHGMIDMLLKDVISNAFGHLVIQGNPGHQVSMIRDRQRVDEIIGKTVKKDDIVDINENLGVMVRAIGNGEADNLVLVGVTPKTEEQRKSFFKDFFTVIDGNLDNYDSKSIEYPVIISQDKAKSLNVKVDDVVKVRVPMVTGQIQAAQLTVIAIANSNNTFMDMVLFAQAERVKSLMGYKPWESASLQINLKDPKKMAKPYADALQQKLKPGILTIAGTVGSEDARILAFRNDAKAKQLVEKNIDIVEGNIQEALDKQGVIIPKTLAEKLDLGVGSEFAFDYATKYQGRYEESFKVSGIYNPIGDLGADTVFMNGERIYDMYDRHLPGKDSTFAVERSYPLYGALATEWKLLDRSANAADLQKKYKLDRRTRSSQEKMDVVTMYEGASQILQLESALNMVTGVVVLVLFFIILIGVINTLRMTIRERTREIGTVRAIGMQKNDVRNMFLLETLMLTAFSCIVGVAVGIIVMKGLGLITFDTSNALNMILKDKHIVFKLNPLSLLSNFALIMAISGVTAFFPARTAARLSAVEALRHYE